MKRDRGGAFTLVELLVVIGIIGVLLSILLPSLSQARAQANLLVCESNLKQIGILIQTYTSENRGLTPPAWMGRGEGSGIPSQNYDCTFADTLTLMTQFPKRYAKAPFFSPYINGLQPTVTPVSQSPLLSLEPDKDLEIFHDVDVAPVGWYPHSCSYEANIRALGAVGVYDPIYYPAPNGPMGYHPRDIGTIQRASEVMMVWCGACDILGTTQTGLGDTFNFGCYLSWPEGLDGFEPYASPGNHNGLCFPTPACILSGNPGNNPYTAIDYANQISLGIVGASLLPTLGNQPSSQGPPVKATDLTVTNQDGDQTIGGSATRNGGYQVCFMRFRHMKNTTGAFLYCDFHVESKRLGEVVARDVCLNPVMKP